MTPHTPHGNPATTQQRTLWATGCDLSVPAELFGPDLPDTPPRRGYHNVATAAQTIQNFMGERMQALGERFPARPVAVLLSGGVDSIAVLAVAVHTFGAKNVVAVTVDADGGTDVVAATAAATHFAVAHHVHRLTPERLVHYTQRAVTTLGCTELWEVSAAVTLLAAVDTLNQSGIAVDAALLTGGGADVLLAGGTHPPNGVSMSGWLTEHIHSRTRTSFTPRRHNPHFHAHVMGDRETCLVSFFQCRAFWELTKTFSTGALYRIRDGVRFDKACLRVATETMGVPASMAWVPKSPMQVSSGVIGGLAQLMRGHVANLPGANTYTDPRVEPAEHVLARLYVREVAPNPH